jgi:hypothetical protein
MPTLRKKKNMIPVAKKKKHQHTVLRLLNDPIRSSVNSEFMTNTSTDMIDDNLLDLATIGTHAWDKYSDPWDPPQIVMLKNAEDSNVWYSFIYDVFLGVGYHVRVEEVPYFIT